jgi:hypothetical protein
VSESQDLREFIREQTLLSERRSASLHAKVMRGLDLQRRAMERHHDKQDRKLDDVLAESQAQREALFKMMDRLDNGGTAQAG